MPLGTAVFPGSWNTRDVGEKGLDGALDVALAHAGARREDIAFLVSTGHGRAALPCADRAVTEITCHARPAATLFPDTGFVFRLQGCQTYGIESRLVKDHVRRELNLPFLALLTDDAPADAAQLRVRIEAYLEMLPQDQHG